MRRRKKKGGLADLPTVEIRLTKEDIIKDIRKHSSVEYPAFSKTISILSEKKVKHIVCLGIGDICIDINARKRLAFVMRVCRELEISVSFFDPITCRACLDLIAETYKNITIETENRNGRYSSAEGCIVGFHLPFFLLNNAVYQNLTKEQIKDFVFIGNSFRHCFRLRKGESILKEVVDNGLIIDDELDFLGDDTFDLTSILTCDEERIDEINESFWSKPRDFLEKESE